MLDILILLITLTFPNGNCEDPRQRRCIEIPRPIITRKAPKTQRGIIKINPCKRKIC